MRQSQHSLKKKKQIRKKIRVYCDASADLKKLKELKHLCEFYQFPYDSSHRPKQFPLLVAVPSEALEKDGHLTFEEIPNEITYDAL